MARSGNTSGGEDPFDLRRFVEAQEEDFSTALAEIRAGRKRSHWMWYIFPQIEGLGFSSMSQKYAIKSLDEAKAYLRHEVLGPRLVRCFVSLLELDGKSAHDIFGSPDDVKLRSCATLFAHASPANSVFQQVLNKYFGGDADAATLRLLSRGD